MFSGANKALTRLATPTISRRASLLTLGGAALATTPGIARAGKGAQSCGKKQQQRCKQNRTQCALVVTDICNGSADCIDLVTPCCDECFSSGFATCLATLRPM
jgi:hypothetical protein